eukprot:4584668-Amphidinium_carterae.1
MFLYTQASPPPKERTTGDGCHFFKWSGWKSCQRFIGIECLRAYPLVSLQRLCHFGGAAPYQRSLHYSKGLSLGQGLGWGAYENGSYLFIELMSLLQRSLPFTRESLKVLVVEDFLPHLIHGAFLHITDTL